LQYFALIGNTVVCMALPAVEFYVDRRGARTPMAGFAMISVLLATVGGYIYAFYTTDSGSAGYWLFNVGFLLMDLFLLGAMVAVYRGRNVKIPTSEASSGVPESGMKQTPPEPERAPA